MPQCSTLQKVGIVSVPQKNVGVFPLLDAIDTMGLLMYKKEGLKYISEVAIYSVYVSIMFYLCLLKILNNSHKN